MIPKILHFIWVGDETKRPDNCINTWVDLNPGYEIKIWGNTQLNEKLWINSEHMRHMYQRELNGVADMMRWEILYAEGGIVIDADSICIRALDDELLDCEAFACWESEMARPGLIAAGYVGSKPENSFIGKIILDIRDEPSVVNDMAWKTVGPQRLTNSYRRYQYHALRIYPSHYFIPEHYSGLKYQGPGPVYAHQMWGSTKKSYDEIHLQKLNIPEQDRTPIQNQANTEALTKEKNLAQPENKTAVETSPLESRHDPYFVQRISVSNELVDVSRFEVFKKLCEGRRVLHIGCADWPITNPATSLHVALEPYCDKLDGYDIHAEAMAALAPYTKGNLYSRFEDIKNEYDLVLVPEVMEHVPDVSGFLGQLKTLKSPCIVITVPDAYQCQRNHFDYIKSTQTFIEVVHPDHNCWYTPYTLENTIKKYTEWKIEGIWFFNRISLLAIIKTSN